MVSDKILPIRTKYFHLKLKRQAKNVFSSDVERIEVDSWSDVRYLLKVLLFNSDGSISLYIQAVCSGPWLPILICIIVEYYGPR